MEQKQLREKKNIHKNIKHNYFFMFLLVTMHIILEFCIILVVASPSFPLLKLLKKMFISLYLQCFYC